MCGIAGAMVVGGRGGTPAAELVGRMVAALGHRGPDDRGLWCNEHVVLGHTRLSIIDLSAAGHQPMHDASGRFVVVFNGELYNYRELRESLEARGRIFRSATDTEVLLNSYVEWGPRALEQWNGMWAVAIFDRETGDLFAARDRAGKKPFYYVIAEDGQFIFASEIKALLAAGLRFRVNSQAAFDFLTQGTYAHLGEQGFLDGVRQLPPAHWLSLRSGDQPRIQRYWDLPVIREKDRVPYDARFRTQFRDVVTDAVSVRLRSDVPVGATLSGGLDSSTIVLLADQLMDGAPLHLFTSLYPGSGTDETPFFETVRSRVRQPVVHRIAPSDTEWRQELTRVLHAQEEPFGDTSILAHATLMQGARAHQIPVILSGQGGDEVLMGYPSLVHAYLGYLLRHGRVARAARELRDWTERCHRPFAPTFKSMLAHALPLRLRDQLRKGFVTTLAGIVTPALREAVTYGRFADEPGRNDFDSYVAQVFKRFSIPHLTHYDDRNSMAYSVESRMPFLDYRVVELMSTVQYDALFRNGVTKRVLRESFADLLPPTIRDRRDKVGFHTPLESWLRRERSWIEEFMTRDRVEHSGFLAYDRYAHRFGELLSGHDAAALEVWRGFIFHLWLDEFRLPGITA